MIKLSNMRFAEVWLFDFEFSAPPGERPTPICLVAWELASGRKMRIWQDELLRIKTPPYDTSKECLFIAYYASAEMGCHLSLNWSMPANVLDLYTEFRNSTNGLEELLCGRGLLEALKWYRIDGIEVIEKDSMRQLAIRGGPWSTEEKEALLEYCESDVAALAKLLPKMEPVLDMHRALLRGRYMKAAAQIEHNGVPIDAEIFGLLQNNWDLIQRDLIARIDADYGIYEGRTFRAALFEDWLIKNNIPWPKLDSGKLDLKDDIFREMARTYSGIAPLRELRIALSQMRLSDLAVGKDARNRCLLSAFSARTSRNQPSNKRFIFGPAVWLRGLIRPESGNGLAYIDWSQQEFGIAAALSEDELMTEAYESGDPYMAFAKQAGAVPPDATKETHKQIRNKFKSCALAVQYGMGAASLAERIDQPIVQAKELLRIHHETYNTFWRWSDAAVDYAMLHNKLWTIFGWTIHIGENPNPRFLRNYLMQANGAEILRLACCFATEKGIRVCAPVHDALLIEAPVDELNGAVVTTQEAMSDASSIVLNGFRLRSDAEIVAYPDRYMDERGQKMWNAVWDLIHQKDKIKA